MDTQKAMKLIGQYRKRFGHAPSGSGWDQPSAPASHLEAGELAQNALKTGLPVPGWDKLDQMGTQLRAMGIWEDSDDLYDEEGRSLDAQQQHDRAMPDWRMTELEPGSKGRLQASLLSKSSSSSDGAQSNEPAECGTDFERILARNPGLTPEDLEAHIRDVLGL